VADPSTLKTKDVLQVVLSDLHSGSNYALFVDRIWEGRQGNTHAPNSMQIKIRRQFNTFAKLVKDKRRGKRVRLIHNGDALDGDHHASNDVCTRDSLQQSEIHIEIMSQFQKAIGWQRGDELYYTKGTQTHVNEFEDHIAKEMNAVTNGDRYVHDILRLETNGVMSWFVHHGPKAGKGANEGNGLYNWLKHAHYDEMKDGNRSPDIIYTGHVHQPTYTAFGYRDEGFTFRLMHGVILPSWQAKTTYAWQKAPMERNRIGGVVHEIKADGTICVPEFCVMVSE